MSVISSYINGNHRTTIYTDGTRVKETGYYIQETDAEGKKIQRWVETDSDNFIYERPENITIKITDLCNAGCLFCSEGSHKDGKIGDLNCQLKYLIKSLKKEGPWSTLTKSNDIRTCSDAVLLKYERPADQSAAAQNKRYNFAMKHYNRFK